MSITKTLRGLVARLRPEEADTSRDAEASQAWSISARLAAAPEIYLKIVPNDLAELVREAKDLHPEMAVGAKRREEAVQAWIQSAVPAQNSAWVDHAYPLQQVTVRLQGTKHSDRAAIIQQLETVLSRLRSGDTTGEEHDDDFGYRFEVVTASSGPSFFDLPSARI